MRYALALLFALAAAAAGAAPAPYRAALPIVVRPTVPGNFEVTAASYLGGAGADSLAAVEVAPDGATIVAGALPGYAPPGAAVTALPGATSGAVVRLTGDGLVASHVTRIGASVADMGLAADGRIGVCGDFGVALLVADGTARIWGASPAPAGRCSTGADGTTALLAGGRVYVYTADGAAVASWQVAGSPQDLAVDSAGGLVVVAGYTQITAQQQMPFVRAYALDGAPRWTDYDFPAGTPEIGTADVRAERVALGGDGLLYVAMSVNGGAGASVLARDPKSAAVSAADRTVVTDTYTNPTNVGSVSAAWYGRFAADDGRLLLAQSLLTRLSMGRGNSIAVRAIAADESGRVLLAGDAYCCIAGRDTLRVASTPVGAYEGGEAYVLALSADFRTRAAWTVFAAPGQTAGGSPALGVAARGGRAAAVATLNPGSGAPRGLITYQAIQPAPGSASAPDGYFVTWPWP